MAAPSSHLIRVRLHFDYPPPGAVGCRLCWLLVDQSSCRVVSDLENLIRDRFELSRRSIVSLFVDECYLPHTESAYVLRDNDCVRVKVEWLPQVNGNSSSPERPAASERRKKRRRAAEEEEEEEEKNEVKVERKKKKSKKRSAESLERDSNQTSGNERKNKPQEEHTEKKKKKKKKKDEKEKLNGPAATHVPPPSTKNTPTSVEQPSKSKKKAEKAAPKKVSSSDSSSSEEEAPPKKPAPKKPAPKTPTSTPAASKAPATTPTPAKPAPPKLRPPPSSSSDSSSSSSDEAPSVKPQPKSKPLKPTTASETTSVASKPQQAAPAAEPDSEEEIQLVIRKPLQQHLQLQPQLGRGRAGQSSRNGYGGRGRPGRGGSGERGRGEGRGGFPRHNGSWDLDYSGAKEKSPHHTQPSYHTDQLRNTSVVLQNGAVTAARPDYSSMPLLAAPPQVGQKIAFKLLELTENYTPEVSEYKEGKILSFDPTTKQIELEVQHFSQAPAEPGKFDLVYLNPDGTERVEYAVSRSSQVMERWDSLLEPRLIV